MSPIFHETQTKSYSLFIHNSHLIAKSASLRSNRKPLDWVLKALPYGPRPPFLPPFLLGSLWVFSSQTRG